MNTTSSVTQVKDLTTKQIDDFARMWITNRSLTLAKSINATLLAAVRQQLKEGFEQGESIQQLTKRISGYYESNQKWMAERLSRTEVIAASNEGALHRYEIEGVDKSEFLAAPDACEICLPLDGKEYVTKEGHGVIPLHPNCRCTWLPVV